MRSLGIALFAGLTAASPAQAQMCTLDDSMWDFLGDFSSALADAAGVGGDLLGATSDLVGDASGVFELVTGVLETLDQFLDLDELEAPLL